MKWILPILLVAIGLSGIAQDSTTYVLTHRGDLPPGVVFAPEAAGADSMELHGELKGLRSALIAEGYLATSIDSVERNGDTVRIYLHVGEKYEWAQLGRGNAPEEVLSRIRFRDRLYHETPISPKNVSALLEEIVGRLTATGYPFAQVSLDSIRWEGRSLHAELRVERNAFTVIDSLIIKGDVGAEHTYLRNHLGIKRGMPYDERLLQRIPSRLRELPFVQPIKPFEIGMREGKADVYLYLERKKASHFDGILGVLPDETTGDILFTGEITLNLMNAFRRGETIGLEWQRLQTQTQELNLGFTYPFLFGTPLGIDLGFNLYRRDTLFTQTKFKAAADYYFLGNDKVSIFIERAASNVLSDSETLTGLYANTRSFMVGVGLEVSDLDYKFNPRSGYYIRTSLATGRKTIDDSPSEATGTDVATPDEVQDIYEASADLGNYLPVGKRLTLLTRLRGGLQVDDHMYRNESYRIGGLKTLRGFDEQSIYATGYAVATGELRFILEQNSNIFVFFDQAYYEDKLREQSRYDNPFGFGGGVNFETGAGVFSLTYALGKQFDNRISVKSGKIHFGFISFF